MGMYSKKEIIWAIIGMLIVVRIMWKFTFGEETLAYHYGYCVEWSKKYPEIKELYEKKMKDGKLTKGEYHSIWRLHNEIEARKFKGEFSQ